MDVFDLVAKIRLDSSEYEDGIGKAKGGMSSLASGIKNGLATVAKVGAAAVSVGVAGVAALTKMGVDGYAQYEQLVGGVETLFKESSNAVTKYAENAYKTSGLSANAYMETVTSFSASLIQSLDGDTAKAAKVADMAITDMSDNANKMGSDIGMIQNAYNGFAKGNYTMLDNLKLGYGGTQEEMKRLLKEAEKISGIKYDISSFSDVAEAIHVIQQNMDVSGYSVDELSEKLKNASLTQEEVSKIAENMGISYEEAFQKMKDGSLTAKDANILLGTTAREAATTIEGSLSMMKGAWSNLVVGMADENANIDVLINNFVDSVGIAAQNLIPRIEQTLAGIGQLIEKLAPIIADALPKVVESLLPTIITSAITLISALAKALVTALPAVKDALLEGLVIILTEVFGMSEDKARGFADGIGSVFTKISDGFRAMVESAQTEGTFLNELWNGLLEMGRALGDVLTAVWEAVSSAFEWCVDQINTDGTLLNQLWTGLQEVVLFLQDTLVVAFDAISSAFTWCTEQISTEGTWLNETWTGIQDAVQALFDFISAAFDAISTAFNWCVDQIKTDGTYLNAVWKNIKAVATAVWEQIKNAISTAVDIIKNIFKLFTSVLKGDWSAAWEAIKNIVSTYWGYIKDTFSNAINLVKNIVGNAWNYIKSITSGIWDGIKSTISGVWESIKSSVSGAITNVKEKISSGLGEAWSTVTDKLNSIKKKFTEIFENCKTIVKDAVTALKNALSFNWSLPKLKLPHISVKGGVAPYGIGGKGSLPSFSISWYKKAYDKAMVLSNPTIFGQSGNSLLGGGDGNGNEIVAGESHLLNLIGQTVESTTAAQNERVISVLVSILEAITDGNEETIQAILSDRKFAVGEREFARLVRTYA